tara:strand:- start:1531 stop:1848 length:318 start_codon:yes stop_codon:yes gene_type:complete
MKKIILLGFILMGLIFSSQVSKFKVEGMMCANGCAWKVKTITQAMDGVSSSEVNFEQGILTVEYDPLKVSSDLIISTLSKETAYKIKPYKDKTRKPFLDWLKKNL